MFEGPKLLQLTKDVRVITPKHLESTLLSLIPNYLKGVLGAADLNMILNSGHWITVNRSTVMHLNSLLLPAIRTTLRDIYTEIQDPVVTYVVYNRLALLLSRIPLSPRDRWDLYYYSYSVSDIIRIVPKYFGFEEHISNEAYL